MSAVLASSTLRGSEPKHDRTATIGPREGVGLRILTLNVRSTYNSSALKTGIPTSEGGLTAVMAREVGDYILASGATVACLQNLNLHADEFEIISQRVGHQWEAVCSHEGKRETTPGVMSGLAVLSKLPIQRVTMLDIPGIAEKAAQPASQRPHKQEDVVTGWKSNAWGQTVPRVEVIKMAPRTETRCPSELKASRCAMVCEIAVPEELGEEYSTVWVVNIQLDEKSEASRVAQFKAFSESLRTRVPAAVEHGHVLCGGLSSLFRPDYSDGAWMWLQKTAALYRQAGEVAEDPSDELMSLLLGESDPNRYIDTRAEAGWEMSFEDGARAEHTTSRDTREDYILLSSSVPWKLARGSFDIFAHPPGLALANNGVVCSLVPRRRAHGTTAGQPLGSSARSSRGWGVATCASWAEMSLNVGAGAPDLGRLALADPAPPVGIAGPAGSPGFRGYSYRSARPGPMVVPVHAATGKGTVQRFSHLVASRQT